MRKRYYLLGWLVIFLASLYYANRGYFKRLMYERSVDKVVEGIK